MLAILQSLRMQQPGCVLGVTGDSGCFGSGSAFMLCHSWDSLAEVCLSRGTTLEKSSGFFSGVLIFQAEKLRSWKLHELGSRQEPIPVSAQLGMSRWGCVGQALELGSCRTRACRAWSLSFQVTCFTVPCSACVEFGEAGGVWGRGCLAMWPWLDLGAGVQVLPTAVLFISWDSLVLGCWRRFSLRLWLSGDAELVNDPWKWGVVAQLVRRVVNTPWTVGYCIQIQWRRTGAAGPCRSHILLHPASLPLQDLLAEIPSPLGQGLCSARSLAVQSSHYHANSDPHRLASSAVA